MGEMLQFTLSGNMTRGPREKSYLGHCQVIALVDSDVVKGNPQEAVTWLKRLRDICCAVVEPPVPATDRRQDDGDVSNDQAGEDLRPGDRGYREPADDRPRVYRDEPDGADRRPEPRDRDDSRGNGTPQNGRQFAAWINKQPREVEDRAKRLMKAWKLGWKYTELREDEVIDIVRELREKPESDSHRGRNGYAESRR